MTDLVVSKWAIEYSFSKNAFYIAPLIIMIADNRTSFESGIQSDLMLLGVYSSKEFMDHALDKFMKIAQSNLLYETIDGGIKVKVDVKQE